MRLRRPLHGRFRASETLFWMRIPFCTQLEGENAETAFRADHVPGVSSRRGFWQRNICVQIALLIQDCPPNATPMTGDAAHRHAGDLSSKEPERKERPRQPTHAETLAVRCRTISRRRPQRRLVQDAAANGARTGVPARAQNEAPSRLRNATPRLRRDLRN